MNESWAAIDLGKVMALASAVAWSSAIILFKRSEAVEPHAMNLFKNTLATALLIVTLLALGSGIDSDRSSEDWVRLIVSGVMGIAVADSLFFYALRRLGASMLAVLDCGYSPLVVLFSVLLLDESLTVIFAIGAALVVGGVLCATWQRGQGSDEVDEKERMQGIVMALCAVTMMALSVVIAKPALDQGELVEVTLIRLVAGLAGLCIWLLPTAVGRRAFAVLRPQRVWWTLVPATLLGTYLAMLLWIGGVKYTLASRAAVLNQMATVFTIIFAYHFLGEQISKRKWLGAGFAVTGAVIVLVGSV